MITVFLKDTITPKIRSMIDQIPTIGVNAVNRAAFQVRKAEQESMKSVFYRPTPWLLSTVYVQQATLQKQQAIVGPNDFYGNVWEKILSPHVYGGGRPQKTVENRMIRTGLLPAGWFIMPARYMPLDDTYGNMQSGELTKILSWLGGLEIGNLNPSSSRKNKTQREGTSYVLSYPGRSRLPPGVYKRVGKQLLMMLIFVQSATYQKRLPWFETAEKAIEEELDKKLRAEIYRLVGK